MQEFENQACAGKDIKGEYLCEPYSEMANVRGFMNRGDL